MGDDELSKFSPERLSVTYRDGTTAANLVLPRRYTLTHSDSTGELFLNIGCDYAWDQVNSTRDEVLGEWYPSGSHSLIYLIHVYIDQGEYDLNTSSKRYETFKRELPLALTAIRYGDRALFKAYPFLDHAPIIITFMSVYPSIASQENWGTFQSYSAF